MSDLVIARLGRTPTDPAVWAAFTGAARDEAGRSENASALVQAFKRMGAGRLAGILPGEQVAMRAFLSPPRNPAKFASAARLLLEDELAQSVDDCHVATHRSDEAGRIYTIDLNVIRRWVDLFAAEGAALSVLVADFDCLGGVRERPVLFVEDDRIVASFGDRAFAAEKNIALALIEQSIAQSPDVELSVYGGPANPSGLSGEHYSRTGPADDDTLLGMAADAIGAGKAVNLLQGAFRPRRRRTVELARWRRPAMAAGIFGAALLALAVADGFRAKRMADRYASEAQRLHTEYFPGAANADPRSHARAVLTRDGGASFLALSDTLGRALSEDGAVAIDRIRFDEARNQLTFSIRSESDADIASFRETLAARGLTTAETGGYRRAGAYWVGDMTARL